MKKKKKFLLISLILPLLLIAYFSIGHPSPPQQIRWGVVFSQKYAESLGLDWKDCYLALMDKLKIKNMRLVTNWDLIEPQKDNYNFEDLDWQIKEAQKREIKLVLTIGMKTGRWPECHLPSWAKNLSKEKQQEEILKLIEKIILRYRDRTILNEWQVENEPFFSFGKCPWKDEKFLEKEVNLVKSLDSRKVVVSDSGEFSFWIKAAKHGDVIGTTLYRRVCFKKPGFYFTHYWFKPAYYWRRAQIIKSLFQKKVICTELQAEPWSAVPLPNLALSEQEKGMNLKQFQSNIEFAKKTGFDEIYLWGGEWWYWLKEKKGKTEIWNEAKKIFQLSAAREKYKNSFLHFGRANR